MPTIKPACPGLFLSLSYPVPVGHGVPSGGFRKNAPDQFGKSGPNLCGKSQLWSAGFDLHENQGERRQTIKFAGQQQNFLQSRLVTALGALLTRQLRQVGFAQNPDCSRLSLEVSRIDDDCLPAVLQQLQQGQPRAAAVDHCNAGGQGAVPEPLNGGDSDSVIPHQRVAEADDSGQSAGHGSGQIDLQQVGGTAQTRIVGTDQHLHLPAQLCIRLIEQLRQQRLQVRFEAGQVLRGRDDAVGLL